MGESTMAGAPFEERFSLPDLVASTLGGRMGDRPIVVHNLARSGWSIYPLLLELERAVAFRNSSLPGALLIYVGHNEGVLTDHEDPGWVASAERSALLGISWIVRDLFEYLQATGALPCPRGLPRYEKYLRRTIAQARRAGLLPVLFTLPSNLSGIEPGVRSSPELLTALQQGDLLERSGQTEAALAHYWRMADEVRSGAALLAYRAAHCEAALGQYGAARESFWKAVDTDTRETFGRATTAQNAAIREIAIAERVPLIDAVALFEAASANRILGNDLFVDGQHPNLRGYALLAAATARTLAPTDAPGEPAGTPAARVEDLVELTSQDLCRAFVKSGTWLLATAVHHPWPHDRMDLAEQNFEAASGRGDDFSAYAGLALAQAARNGLLASDQHLAVLAATRPYYRDAITVPESDWNAVSLLLREFGTDPLVLRQLGELWAGGSGRPPL